MNDYFIYEQPISEPIRACLKLEALFNKLQNHEHLPTAYATQCLLEALDILDRPDLKAKWLQQLTHIQAKLQEWMSHEQVDQASLTGTLAAIDQAVQILFQQNARLMDNLREHPFLQKIRHSFLKLGSQHQTDIPAFFYWENQQQYREQLSQWISAFTPIKKIVMLLLDYLRHSQRFTPRTASHGFYEEQFKVDANCQLIRVRVHKDIPVIPEISVSRHKINIHFYKPSLSEQHTALLEAIPFELNTSHL